MGDGGGNLEEQIRSVEEQIRRVEEQIDKCSGDEERQQLRREEEQLRDEKAQLRRKEEQLRALVIAIAQGRDKCTEYEWLRQDLPSWNSVWCPKTPSTMQKERMYTPVRVEYWNVVKDIEDYVNKADKLKRIYQKVGNPAISSGEGNLKTIVGSVVGYTCDFVSKKQPGSLVIYGEESKLELPPAPLAEGGNSENPDGSETEGSDVQKCLYYARPPRADMLVKSNGKDVAVFDLKNGGLGCPVPIYKLWARCSCRTGIDLNCWCNSDINEGRARSILNCILQVYEYLVFAKVGYGVLTDIQNWYLFKRDNTGCLYISVGFKWDDRQPPLPAAIAYLVNSAVAARGEFDVSPGKGEPPWSWETSPFTSPSGGSKDDEDKDDTYEPNEDEIGGCKTSPARSRGGCSNTRQKQLQEIPAADLHLDDRPITSAGWSGCVVGGTLNGRRVAVKFAPCNSDRADALLNEVSAYQKLQEHWGVFVPPLVGYGTTADGRIVFIATELIDGSPLGPGTVTEEVATAALQALGAVHACKLLHGDVEARNIMVVRGTQASVRLVDFGFAQCSSNRKWQKAELRQLQRLLQDMMGVGVGKESGVRHPHKQLCLV